MPRLSEFQQAIELVPAGAWAVGVSGGADSVALLSLLRERPDLSLHVVHLNHQTRGQASDDDAMFVRDLAARWQLGCTVFRLEDAESGAVPRLKNPSARFRRARLALFKKVVVKHGLAGVILGHHADDQAETILLRLLRGANFTSLGGMLPKTVIEGLTICRPMLDISRHTLRTHLQAINQPWREDESNTSRKYARNRVRVALAGRGVLTNLLLDLASSARELRRWCDQMPPLPGVLPLGALQDLPTLLARQQAWQWLIAAGANGAGLQTAALDRLIKMASDRATPARQQFAGPITVRRRGASLRVE